MSCTNPNCECKTGSYANLNPPTRAAVDAQVKAIQHIVREPLGKTVYSVEIAGYTIKLRKRSANSFTVVYGKQVKRLLTYADAAKELGQCIMHALACEGRLD
jgi:hypothetical protein